jgi:UDP-N-acetyl-D-glucosamine dehydrogenase
LITVGVVGLGHVGFPLAVAFAQKGCDVIALDLDARKLDAIEAGESDVEDLSSEAVQTAAGRIHATTRYSELATAHAVLVCVPGSFTFDGEPYAWELIRATRALADVLQRGQLVVLESGLPPDIIRERIAPILEESGLAAGRDFHLAFSTEAVDHDRTDLTLHSTPKVLSGLTDRCAERAKAVYGLVCRRVIRV